MKDRQTCSRSQPRRSQDLEQPLAHQAGHRDALALLAGGEGEPGLAGVGDAGDRRRGVAGRDLLHGGDAGLEGGEQVAEDDALLGDPVHLDGDLGDDAEAALASRGPSRGRWARSTCWAAPRSTSTRPGMTTRRPRVMSAMSPYLSDCMPEERVATQPPSVEWVKLSGKWPRVQPRALSCASRSGPSAPAWIRASPDSSSTSSTFVSRPRSRLTTGRVSSSGACRLPAMLLPPPKGMSTASAAMASVDDLLHLGLVRRGRRRRRAPGGGRRRAAA